MYPNLYVEDLYFYWICLVAVHIMLLDVVCACKGLQDPLDLLCECMFVSFFDLYDQLWYMSSIYCFLLWSSCFSCSFLSLQTAAL